MGQSGLTLSASISFSVFLSWLSCCYPFCFCAHHVGEYFIIIWWKMEIINTPSPILFLSFSCERNMGKGAVVPRKFHFHIRLFPMAGNPTFGKSVTSHYNFDIPKTFVTHKYCTSFDSFCIFILSAILSQSILPSYHKC